MSLFGFSVLDFRVFSSIELKVVRYLICLVIDIHSSLPTATTTPFSIGAIPSGTGSKVRVFVPNATSLSVIGHFNDWNDSTAIPLTLDPGGSCFWEGEVAGLVPGSESSRYELLLGWGTDGRFNRRLDPAARDTDSSDRNNTLNKSHVVDLDYPWSEFKTPLFDDLIMYQCHIGSFCGYGDALETPNRVATFDHVQTKLNYIRDLGFTAIALLPVQEFRFDRSWGYNPAFYFALESAYGRPEDLRSLVNACHKRGLAVIFDVVYNHVTGDPDSSFKEFDVRGDGTGDSYLGTHETYRTDWGGTAPAFWREGIREFFVENMGMYLKEYRGDGLRFDSTRTMERTTGKGNDGWEFMQHLTSEAKHRFPGKYLIAEHLPDDESILISGGFHAQWALEPFYRMVSALQGNDPVDNIEALIGNSFGPRRNYPYSWNTVIYLLGSHDECGDNHNGQKAGYHRHYVERFGGRGNWFARAKSRMAWSLNVAMKGTPMLFMGSECHLDGYWHDDSDNKGDHRFNWNIAGDDKGMSMRHLVRAANDTRRSHSALRNGHLMVTHRDRSGSVIAFKRWNDDDDVILVVVNCSDQTYDNHTYGVAPEQRGRWQQILCSQDASFGGWEGAGNAYYEPITQDDGHIYVNVPEWSVTMFRLTSSSPSTR